MQMVSSVFSAPHHSHLFTDDDRTLVARFESLTPSARRLYIRLLQRRDGWFRVARLQYAEIADVGGAVAQLVGCGFACGEDSLGMHVYCREEGICQEVEE